MKTCPTEEKLYRLVTLAFEEIMKKDAEEFASLDVSGIQIPREFDERIKKLLD